MSVHWQLKNSKYKNPIFFFVSCGAQEFLDCRDIQKQCDKDVGLYSIQMLTGAETTKLFTAFSSKSCLRDFLPDAGVRWSQHVHLRMLEQQTRWQPYNKKTVAWHWKAKSTYSNSAPWQKPNSRNWAWMMICLNLLEMVEWEDSAPFQKDQKNH